MEKKLVRRILTVWKRPQNIIYRLHQKIRPETYTNWYKKYEMPSKKKIKQIESHHYFHQPDTYFVIKIQNLKGTISAKTLKSLEQQTFPYWVYDNQYNEELSGEGQKRIHPERRKKMKALFLIIENNTQLSRKALSTFFLFQKMNQSSVFFYCDEDQRNSFNKPLKAFCKPKWDSEWIWQFNYVGHCFVIQEDYYNQLDSALRNSKVCSYKILLHLITKFTDQQITHVPQILFHQFVSNHSKKHILNRSNLDVDEHIELIKELYPQKHKVSNIDVSLKRIGRYQKIHISLQLPNPSSPPLISIIISTKDQAKMLSTCIDSIIRRTDQLPYEIIIINNNSEEKITFEYFEQLKNLYSHIRIIDYLKPFNFSAINNFAIEEAKGDVVVLMNNDIEVIHRGWLNQMLQYALREDIGAVGPKLLYPDHTIQHAGVVLGFGGVAGHVDKRLPAHQYGTFGQHFFNRQISAVTAACLMVKKSIYTKVGGLDETNLKIAFNDVDFCLKVQQLGLKNIFLGDVVLFHHESVSRGSDQTPENKKRFDQEHLYMRNKWKEVLLSDPFYSPNYSLQSESPHLSFPPRHHLDLVSELERVAAFNSNHNWGE